MFKAKTEQSPQELEAKLTEAQSTLSAARQVFEQARAQYGAEPTDAHRAAKRRASESVEDGEDVCTFLTGQLEQARACEAAAERERMQARAAEIRDLVRHDGIERELAPLRGREVALLLQVVQVRRERQLLQDRLNPLLGEYHGLMDKLGQDPTLDHRIGNCDNYVATEQALRAHAADYPDGDPCRALLREVAPGLRSYSRQ